MIKTLNDREEFRRLRRLAWEGNIDYWLSKPLRHIEDIGEYIANRVHALCNHNVMNQPIIIDMGFGSAWLLRALIDRDVQMSYVGWDSLEAFVDRATATFRDIKNARFFLADVERDLDFPIQADLVVNAFNFLELCDLSRAMANAATHLRPGGTLLMSTIDKTYLMLALSSDRKEFYGNLALYQELAGTKYGFQHIDMGAHVSETLEYPSVLYSTQDFIDAASEHGLNLVNYVEHPFTAKTVPKIYCHLEFQRAACEPGAKK